MWLSVYARKSSTLEKPAVSGKIQNLGQTQIRTDRRAEDELHQLIPSQ